MWRRGLQQFCCRPVAVRCGPSGLKGISGAAAARTDAEPHPSKDEFLTLADFLPGGSMDKDFVKPERKVVGMMPGPVVPPGESVDALTSAEESQGQKAPVLKKPPWLKMTNPNLTKEGGERYKQVRASVKDLGLATVCQEARCPNVGECWSSGTATVMIMGDTCTRGCRFCAVATSRRPPPLDADEPDRVAQAVTKWGLDYVVLTMVDRDDVEDQGASHIAATVRHLKSNSNNRLRVETLVGDFQGRMDLVEQVVNSGMEVFAHNIETVERLQRTVRDRRAGYAQTLNVLRHAKEARPDVVTKSSLMLGLGETDEEVHQTIRDLRDHGVDIITFGQYLQPTKRHMKVTRYLTPAEFDAWARAVEDLGLHCASGPLVRSSYRAGDLFKARLAKREAALEASEETLDLSIGGPPPLRTSTGGPKELSLA
eukprot:gnl/TRDRNA2_/TRDRNA2_184700_c0_seq1.p1 gnl/TRDRNA2_/TRDRNA2_184700_c0~~gnl/TRDRNA2_/TRDRNA2_184700_c0_seq1.p1  ORF type:complete len:438 (+),score=87.22 gnl/TRDRNA2_/TRDRNA2_184700_c0_seq1:36-1316(+)